MSRDFPLLLLFLSFELQKQKKSYDLIENITLVPILMNRKRSSEMWVKFTYFIDKVIIIIDCIQFHYQANKIIKLSYHFRLFFFYPVVGHWLHFHLLLFIYHIHIYIYYQYLVFYGIISHHLALENRFDCKAFSSISFMHIKGNYLIISVNCYFFASRRLVSARSFDLIFIM